MMDQIPKLLFVGAGNIAQSIIKGITRARPNATSNILVTAPTRNNLDFVENTLECRTVLLRDASDLVEHFKPDYTFLCMKPQIIMDSISDLREDSLLKLLKSTAVRCSTTVSLIGGLKVEILTSRFGLGRSKLVRVMLNTAAEVRATSIVYYTDRDFKMERVSELENLMKLISQAVVRINNENLMDTATGVCGSGIAFFYEFIQAISDVGVKNGLNRADATMIAAQLSKSAGEMFLEKRVHPYQLRDEVSSPSGTTIYGLNVWHCLGTSHKITEAIQASIDRSSSLSHAFEVKCKEELGRNQRMTEEERAALALID